MFLIQVDIDDVIDLEIKPDHYILMQLISKRKYELIFEIWDTTEIKALLEELEVKRHVKHCNTFENEIELSKVIIKYKFLSKLTVADRDLFMELYNAYPAVASGRRLRLDKRKSREKYEKIIKSDVELHKRILACLQLEINELQSTGRLKYMKALPTWINNYSWEAYEDVLLEQPTKESKYGTEIV